MLFSAKALRLRNLTAARSLQCSMCNSQLSMFRVGFLVAGRPTRTWHEVIRGVFSIFNLHSSISNVQGWLRCSMWTRRDFASRQPRGLFQSSVYILQSSMLRDKLGRSRLFTERHRKNENTIGVENPLRSLFNLTLTPHFPNFLSRPSACITTTDHSRGEPRISDVLVFPFPKAHPGGQ